MENVFSIGQSEKQVFITRTYGWMFLALLVSAVSAFVTVSTPEILRFVFASRFTFLGICIAELILVMYMTARIRTMTLPGVILGFLLYSVLNGITISSIFLVYRLDSIATVFVSTACMFGVMCFYGAVTKRDLSSLGHYLMMGLTGIIIAVIVNWVAVLITHQRLELLNIFISVASVIIFTGLTAYDSQKLIRIAEHSNGSEDYKKISIVAALELYLDFINLFLALLRLFGKRK